MISYIGKIFAIGLIGISSLVGGFLNHTKTKDISDNASSISSSTFATDLSNQGVPDTKATTSLANPLVKPGLFSKISTSVNSVISGTHVLTPVTQAAKSFQVSTTTINSEVSPATLPSSKTIANCSTEFWVSPSSAQIKAGTTQLMSLKVSDPCASKDTQLRVTSNGSEDDAAIPETAWNADHTLANWTIIVNPVSMQTGIWPFLVAMGSHSQEVDIKIIPPAKSQQQIKDEKCTAVMDKFTQIEKVTKVKYQNEIDQVNPFGADVKTLGAPANSKIADITSEELNEEVQNAEQEEIEKVPVCPIPELSPTAECVDGTTSYSLHEEGTCSYHDGVDFWINRPLN